ncbi:MAG: PTS sugar transporter subunit IIA [Spirochaetes bacterium]|nr:PTS sugar transporter subunit IIA [Spirochaetota bacterium]
MSLIDITEKNCIKVDLESLDKEGVIEELVDLLVNAGKIKDKQKAIDDIMEREKKGSTGLEKGIAVPHAKTEAVDKLSLAFGISKDGVDFNAMDGEYSYLILLLLAPPGASGPHVEALASIARFLTPPVIREKLKNVKSSDDIINIIIEYENS